MARHRGGTHADGNGRHQLCDPAGRHRSHRRLHRRLPGRYDSAIPRHLSRTDHDRPRRRRLCLLLCDRRRVHPRVHHQRAGADIRCNARLEQGVQSGGLLVHARVDCRRAADSARARNSWHFRSTLRPVPAVPRPAGADEGSARQSHRVHRRGCRLRDRAVDRAREHRRYDRRTRRHGRPGFRLFFFG